MPDKSGQVSVGGNRVVVTGLGVVTSLGIGIAEFWKNIIAGRSGIDVVQSFDVSEFSCKIAGEVRNFEASDYMDGKSARRNDRFVHYAVAGSKLALQDANINIGEIEPEKFGVIIGSGIGGMQTINEQSRIFHEKGAHYVSPFMVPSLICNMASGIVAIEVGARGANFSAVSACTSGTHAIGEAYHMLKLGKADVILAGGSEAAVSPLSFAGFCAMRAMSTTYNDRPNEASRPFDATRDGFVMANGSGIIVLETLRHAIERRARIYCELAGYSASCDAYHITSPDPEAKGLIKCFVDLFRETGVSPAAVDYINAHGTSTEYNDKIETKAIGIAFGDHAKNLLISSTKSMTGHLLGAAGGIEASVCAKVIETGKIPPTINYNNPDPDCYLNYVPNVAMDADINMAISDNLGFGGQNGALLFKKLNHIK
ncbi:MAG: beta-ketoacyl-ACP synthase II [Puniceicoccales bacterium]|jgi:3-oxoacyl-[acyl-carrier-protein] synthase II|nr:beta-ketoacyl-ACP synthase II [Puniceicoccales bacterium]